VGKAYPVALLLDIHT